MSRAARLVLTAATLGCLLAGCGKDRNDVASMSRADQEKAFQGKPEIGMKIGEEMKRRYLGGRATGGRPQGAPPAHAGTK